MKLICTNQYSVNTGEARLVYQETPKNLPLPTTNLGEQVINLKDKPKPEPKLPKEAQGLLDMMRKGLAEAPAKIDTAVKTEGKKTVGGAMTALGKLEGVNKMKTKTEKQETKGTEVKKEFSPAEKKYAEKTERTLALAEKAGESRRQAEAARKTADQSQRMIGAAERYKVKLDQAAEEETDPLEKIRKEDAAGDAALRVIDAKLAFEKAEKYAKAAETVADKAQKETMVASTEMDKAETATAVKKSGIEDLGKQVINLKDKPKPVKAMPGDVASFLKTVQAGTAQAEAREAAANAKKTSAKKQG